MSGHSPSTEQLRRETGEARLRYSAAESDLEARRRQPSQPGDLFVLAATAELPLEWAVLERDREAPGRLLVVPADGNLLVGSADLAVAVVSRSPVVLRCRFGVWLEEDALDPEMRTGSLEPEELTRARQKWRELQGSNLAGSPLERDVDVDPEYQDWVEDVLEKARSALSEDSRELAAGRPVEKPAEVLPFPTRSRWHSLSNPYAIAASILLLLSLGLGREVFRMAEQRDAGLSGPVLNLPFFVLAGSGLRSDEKTISIPSGADMVMLIFQLDAADRHPRHRLEIRQADSDREVWASADLRVNAHSELSVVLPVSLLPANTYRLLLTGLDQDREHVAARYLLRIEVE